MLRDILENEKIEYFGAVPVSVCKSANQRLYASVPENSYAVFMLFPYFVADTASGLAKFAAVPDYHFFADRVFKNCEAYLSEKYPDKYIKGFTDHSPLAECDGACRAGLGIMGRHSMLINEKYSSFVCIGEIICELSPEELISEGIPMGGGRLSFCEGCALCERSCPGKCCGESLRDTCLSAITQKKRELSEDESIMVHSFGYTWGCDICSLSCPHSQNTPETPIDYFKDGAIRGDAYTVIEAMDEDTFAKYPFSWRKKEIIMRNFQIRRNGNG